MLVWAVTTEAQGGQSLQYLFTLCTPASSMPIPVVPLPPKRPLEETRFNVCQGTHSCRCVLCCCSAPDASVSLSFVPLPSTVVHQGGVCGCQDQAHRPVMVPWGQAAWAHYGLLGHRTQASGEHRPLTGHERMQTLWCQRHGHGRAAFGRSLCCFLWRMQLCSVSETQLLVLFRLCDAMLPWSGIRGLSSHACCAVLMCYAVLRSPGSPRCRWALRLRSVDR